MERSKVVFRVVGIVALIDENCDAEGNFDWDCVMQDVGVFAPDLAATSGELAEAMFSLEEAGWAGRAKISEETALERISALLRD